MSEHHVPLADGGSILEKEWACVYGDCILLKADTEEAVRKKMRRTRVPDGVEVIALPKAHGSIWL